MLKCDFGNLHREVQLLERAGAKLLHLDVMDGHFVPNLSYGPMVIESLRRLTNLPLDAHLMISEPARYVDAYIAAGCDGLIVHVEATGVTLDLLRYIRGKGVFVGVAVNPETPLAHLDPLLAECDELLVMSVEPGFGGQKFMPVSLDKLRELRGRVSPQTLLSIDGGVGLSTIGAAASAGARLFVVGSAIFDAHDYGEALIELTTAARQQTVPSALES